MSWTPVSQGYPKKLFECLVTVFQPQIDEDNEDTFVTEARYLHDNKWDFYYSEYYQYDTSQWAVIAWMDKPKLPKPYNDFKEELTMYSDPKLYKEGHAIQFVRKRKKYAGLRNGKIVEFSNDKLSLNHDHIDQIIEIELDEDQ